ncbi:ankyrin repeat domain-containing protein 13B-like, partial [Trifolium medium]|nr:ankyrin repeat domain-containing protein 13B-like [Trifolium medium]
KKKKGAVSESKNESEYKKGLRPVLWLTPDFPLKTDELLPLLDILANKVKAIRRLRELLTTKLPHGTFPVKLASCLGFTTVMRSHMGLFQLSGHSCMYICA